MFTKLELEYLKSQPIARLATTSKALRPNVAPVGFEYDGRHFFFGSIKQEILHSTPKYKNVKSGSKWVAITIDDLVSEDPWTPRGIRVNGVADIVEREGEFGKGDYIRVAPRVSWSWGIAKSRTKSIWK
ncbi:MAG: PPOX class F420-dependent oxidoreductase [Thaumarchaeota archaeon]|nr:PPOX class F420-dependent oxidoreductase [Nitrososphaerota archaeon]